MSWIKWNKKWILPTKGNGRRKGRKETETINSSYNAISYFGDGKEGHDIWYLLKQF